MRWMTSGFDKCASHSLAEQVWWLCPVDSIRPDKATVRLAATGEVRKLADDGDIAQASVGAQGREGQRT